MKKHRFVKVLRIVLFAIVAAAALSFIVMSLWNVLMPSVFGVRTISFWQALGLLLLSKILFGGFRPYAGGGPRWRGRMMERWEKMTPEEREKFRQGMRRGCGPRQNVEGSNREAGAQA
jgi:hypothetical protein